MADTITSLALIPIAGVAAAWVAWRLRIPSILALLGAGLLLGPALGWLEPDPLLGELLQPAVALAVALILFEGGLSLSGRELRASGRVVSLLLTVGVAITFAVATGVAFMVLGLPGDVAAVLGAVVVVTGPTVVGPLLASIRPRGDIGAVLKTEGILVDPIGAILATLVYEATFGRNGSAVVTIGGGLVLFAVCGLVVGVAFAYAALFVLRRYLVPDNLVTAFGLALAVGGFALANALVDESGLLAATVMGIVIGTRQRRDVRELLEFHESLRTLLIAALFVILGARLTTAELESIDWRSFVFVLALILVARPAAVALCTIGSTLTWRERVLAAWMAPRGIVAAAVASVFALRLQDGGEQDAEVLVPTVFLTILVTIAVYGLTAPILARRLKLADTAAQGLLVIGAGPLAVAIGRAVHQAGFRVLLADTDHDSVADARAAGLEGYQGSIASEEALAELDLRGLGRMLACTDNREVAALATIVFSRSFGRQQLFQVPVTTDQIGRQVARDLRARSLATSGAGVIELTRQLALGGAIELVGVGPDGRLEVGDADPSACIPLFLVHDRTLQAAAVDGAFRPAAGDQVVAFVPRYGPRPAPA